MVGSYGYGNGNGGYGNGNGGYGGYSGNRSHGQRYGAAMNSPFSWNNADDVPMTTTPRSSVGAAPWIQQQQHPSINRGNFFSSHRQVVKPAGVVLEQQHMARQPLGLYNSGNQQDWPPSCSPPGLVDHARALSPDDQMQIQELNGSGATLYYCPTLDPETGFTILSISAMSFYRNKSHEEIRWDCYCRGDPMLADPLSLPTPSPSTKGIAGALPPGTYYLVPASQWSPPPSLPLITPLVFCAAPPPPATVIDERSLHDHSRSHPQQQQQQPPSLSSFTFKSSHPFGKLPHAQQISFKSSNTFPPTSVGTRSGSPLLVLPSRPVLRSRFQTSRSKACTPPPVIWDEPPPPEIFLRATKNPRSLFIPPQANEHETPVEPSSPPLSMPESSEPGPSNQVAEPEAEPFVPTPKVTGSDYYIQPSPEEIRERHLSTPGGYCHRVDNFVVGRKQHGEIRFIGRTDVRELDVCDAVQFDKNQVIVYMDESKKPGVGDGLNKPAEVTLFNIHWNDNLDGQEQQEQQQQQFEMMLRDESERQGSHFISYDAASGEWKFLVDHFSTFGLQCKTLAT